MSTTASLSPGLFDVSSAADSARRSALRLRSRVLAPVFVRCSFHAPQTPLLELAQKLLPTTRTLTVRQFHAHYATPPFRVDADRNLHRAGCESPRSPAPFRNVHPV